MTLYGTLDTTFPVNRIKFTEPVKSFLLENNIWIKPDYYSTSTVSSPGFFTLIHPKLTNKVELVKDITAALKSTKNDPTEPLFLDWCARSGLDNTDREIPVPRFHVENSTRKWGNIQVEVLSLYCTSNDAKYMKYLLAEASSQQTFTKGLYIPSGIHLMEGKETLTNILQEQVDFIHNTTSFQIEGISYADMKTANSSDGTIEEILLRGPGVNAVEPTYQTSFRGQWQLVITPDRATQLIDYIKLKLPSIYKNKRGQQAKLVTHQKDTNNGSYKIAIVGKTISRVGTYAEVLTRRFTLPNQSAQRTEVSMKTARSHLTQNQSRTQPPTVANTPTSSQGVHSVPEMVHQANLPQTSLDHDDFMDTQIIGDDDDKQQIDTTTWSHAPEHQQDIEDTPIETYEQKFDEQKISDSRWHTKLLEIENKLTTHETNLESTNTHMLSQIEDKLDERIEKIMESKLLDLSLAVADIVTKRLTKAMGKIVKGAQTNGTQ